ncbi:MAG: sigma-70 family RNA polymerase sigma factor [Chthonomonadales bacterium]|nr:sigma-70 family RNA polymerase sigma factor [Chthonomonadales bacterium]
MHPGDDALIARVQGGDREAFLALFDRYYARIERYAGSRLRNAETASDVASETFLRAYRSVMTYRVGENRPYIGYLLQICRRLIIAETSRRGAIRTCSLDTEVSEVESISSSWERPLADLLDEERRTMVRRALDFLSADDREIVALAFERDLSRRDIAAILGKPTVSAVTSHLHRAITKLRGILLKQGYFNATAPLGGARGDAPTR